MAEIKSYTDLEQSKALSKIIWPESADFCWGIDAETLQFNCSPYPCPWKDYTCKEYYVPCWSLAALLELLPYEICDDDGESNFLSIDKEDDKYHLVYSDPQGYFDSIESDRFDNCVDACYEMIMKLNEENLL